MTKNEIRSIGVEARACRSNRAMALLTTALAPTRLRYLSAEWLTQASPRSNERPCDLDPRARETLEPISTSYLRILEEKVVNAAVHYLGNHHTCCVELSARAQRSSRTMASLTSSSCASLFAIPEWLTRKACLPKPVCPTGSREILEAFVFSLVLTLRARKLS